MNAIASGSAGVAILYEGNTISALKIDDLENTVPCNLGAVRWYLRDATDLRELKNVTLAQIKNELAAETDRAKALDIALILLDREQDNDVCRCGAEELEELMPVAGDALRAIFFAQPFHKNMDVRGAITHCEEAGSKQALDLLKALVSAQPLIRDMRTAWEEIPQSHFDSDESRAEARWCIIRAGGFYDLYQALTGSKRLGDFEFAILGNSEIQQIKNYRKILPAWIARFKTRSPNTGLTKESLAKLQAEDEVDLILDTVFDVDLKQSIERQKEAIRKEILSRHLNQNKFERYVRELIDFQSRHGGPEFVCMSLCDLAKFAQGTGKFKIQLYLTSKSIELKTSDYFSWTQHGKALQNLSRFDEAIKAYDTSLSINRNRYCLNSKADLLKDMNRFSEALATYEETIKLDPEDVVARNGKAEVLKSMNCLPEALAAYEETIKLHPEDVVTRSGKAEVLKSMNRLPEALSAYEEIMRLNPEDVVALCGKAEVLKLMNRLPEALMVYEETIKLHPENVVARSGRAEVLKSMNRLPEALTAYEETIKLHPENVVARCGKAGVLIRMNRLDEALKLLPKDENSIEGNWIGYHIKGTILACMKKLEEAEKVFAFGFEHAVPSSKDYYRASLAIVQMSLLKNYGEKKFAQCQQLVESIDSPGLNQVKILLSFHIFGATGKLTEAIECYGKLGKNSFSSSFDNAKEELKRRYVTSTGPASTDEQLVNWELECVEDCR